jgi:phospholipid N-methyltransferase
MKLKHPSSKKNEDLIKNLGDFIEEHFKNGVKKIEKVLKEKKEKSHAKDQDGDEKVFSYIRAFLEDKGVSSVMPSSKYIIKRVIKGMDLKKAKIVVEYGAAEGVITREILSKLGPDARLIALEFNEKLFAELKHIKDPRLTAFCGDVREIEKFLADVPKGSVDAITSGIPFAFLRGRERHELLTKTSDWLKPGGRFVPYQVTTHLIPLLEDYFSKVKTEFEIRNLPPHFVFTAYK